MHAIFHAILRTISIQGPYHDTQALDRAPVFCCARVFFDAVRAALRVAIEAGQTKGLILRQHRKDTQQQFSGECPLGVSLRDLAALAPPQVQKETIGGLNCRSGAGNAFGDLCASQLCHCRLSATAELVHTDLPPPQTKIFKESTRAECIRCIRVSIFASWRLLSTSVAPRV